MYYSIRRRNTINTRTISKIPAPGDLYYVHPDDVTKRNPNDNDKGDPIPEAQEEEKED
jgi:hypothetical protein